MRNIESLSCDVSNGMVYVYDQDGNMVDTYSYPDIENAYSTGRGIVIETESMVYTYSLHGNYLKCVGSRFRNSRPKPPPHDLIAKVSNRTEQYRDTSSDYTPSRSYGGGNGSPGCWFTFIIFAILYCVIYQKGCSHTKSDRPTPVVKKEYQGREYIRECIKGWNSCRLVAITKNGGNIAVAGKNSCAACGAYPNQFWKAIEEISNAGRRITDVGLTDKGKWVVLYGNNGWQSNGLPKDMLDKMRKFDKNNERLLSVTVNDKDEWVVISDKHFSAYPKEIFKWLSDTQEEYGDPIAVSLTDDAGAAIFERGYSWRGNYPEDLRKSIKNADYEPSVIRMAGNSWFYANETGRYTYSL